MKLGVIIPAAGTSSRFGANKLTEDLGGRPLLLRTVEFFTKRDDVVEIVVAAPPNELDEFRARFAAALSFHGVSIIPGGLADRWESVQKALAAMKMDVDRIVIHDAARPALTTTLFERLLLASKELSAVAAAEPMTGTLKKVTGELVTISDDDVIADSILGEASQSTVDAHAVQKTIDREGMWVLQTPQIFEPSLLKRAYDQENLSGVTDDAQVIERLGETVYLVKGDSRNIKVTTPADLQLVKAILGVKREKPRQAHKQF